MRFTFRNQSPVYRVHVRELWLPFKSGGPILDEFQNPILNVIVQGLGRGHPGLAYK
jgi:hypothetical protein